MRLIFKPNQSFKPLFEIQVLAESNRDVLLLVAQLGEHRDKDLGGIGTGGLLDTHIGDRLQNGLPTLLLIVSQLLVAKVRASKTDILLNILLIDLGTGHHHLGIGQNNGNLIATALDVLLGKLGEIDICLDLGVHRDGDLAIGQGDFEVKGFAEQLALQAEGIVVGDDFVYAILGGVEFGALLDISDYFC